MSRAPLVSAVFCALLAAAPLCGAQELSVSAPAAPAPVTPIVGPVPADLARGWARELDSYLKAPTPDLEPLRPVLAQLATVDLTRQDVRLSLAPVNVVARAHLKAALAVPAFVETQSQGAAMARVEKLETLDRACGFAYLPGERLALRGRVETLREALLEENRQRVAARVAAIAAALGKPQELSDAPAQAPAAAPAAPAAPPNGGWLSKLKLPAGWTLSKAAARASAGAAGAAARAPPPPASNDALAKEQKKLYRQFVKKEDFSGSSFKRLPAGIPARLRPGLDEIRLLLRDREALFQRMDEFERDVYTRSRARGLSLETAREQILEEWEAKNGFGPVRDLDNKAYSGPEWRAMLSEGRQFRDGNFADAKRKGSDHGSLTHRIQWHVVMRDLAARPQAFGGVTQAVELYKALGELDAGKLDWSGTGITDNDGLWYHLFDSWETNFSRPEYFRRKHQYWPKLGDWD